MAPGGLFIWSRPSIESAVLIITAITALCLGRYPIGPGTIIKVLFHSILPVEADWAKGVETVIFQVRLPRILAGFFVGAGLALSGASLQSMFRNPLVSSQILGVASGAGFGAAVAILLFESIIFTQLSSFVFGLAAVGLTWALSHRKSQTPIILLVLSGVVVGSLFSSLTSMVKYLADPFPLIDKGPAAGEVAALPVPTLISWAADIRSLLRSGIGIAVCNALAPWDEMQSPELQDSAEAADIRDGDVVGMVGFFPPLVKKLEKRDIELRVFERDFKQPHPCLYPDWAENRLLPDCDVVIMTGTSCINGTIDQLLEYCTGARAVSVTGPSTPMYPRAFAGTRATILAGAKYRPEQKEELFNAISLGSCGAETLNFLDKFAWRL